MPRHQESAYILRKWDIGESDQLVSFFTLNRGRLRGIAKGAKRSKKRFGGLLSPFMLVKIEYFEKPNSDLVRIEGCALIYYYTSIYADLEKLLVGCNLLEMIERVLPERERSDRFFRLLQRSFEYLDERGRVDAFWWIFLVKCLALLGLQPQFRHCIHCRRPLGEAGLFGFSVPQGGAVCGLCIHKGTATHRISADTLLIMHQWLTLPFQSAAVVKVPLKLLNEAEMILEAFLSYHVTRDLRSLRILKEIKKKLFF